ncbi:4-hydroxy-3-methylbut-2-enyl diphosphate reductase [Hydrogenimonas thermophila]|uniref:4-hydroxy-3-methylbut-2-enyl diphosphate reductase n=1 Tax=Hydrogenimonas thermophila TaxID=223786 RepID=A0A1I5QSG3_9BACT|nr:4-hydroxy-3-methylbut-2-enyl diphosphate reductase [Hydrogenimonas thermophila]WOE69330.1 4-hydroxy-3-methylbut-2-enyl diphosphate reductase [Hydrogenimonas thermophila]WOE71840.1 4-hydroxy-3-methylbut-2-enyl diphosphate reductase [Hydrogenimonas thermophila]SFP49172.1 4-hydroxy-3-methylbut-2-enyl diphosphate reductase [Hydrogenimonas thermophila]
MKIELAESYGFCFGVKRAIKIAEENPGSATLGPLIHNNMEIARLKRDFNVSLVESLDDVKPGSATVIRTHGIPKNDLKELLAKNTKVIDATCPFVTKPQQIVEEMSQEGYDIVIFGDKNHPEIKGVMSYATGPVYAVLSIEDLEKIHLRERVAVIAQTTRKIEEYNKIVNWLVPRHKEVRVFNTICNATFENQDAAKELAKRADVMIVVGGKQSSNTKQLHSICKSFCPDSYHIESKDELQKEWFDGKKLCGVTAGASTPEWIIEEIIGKIREFKV